MKQIIAHTKLNWRRATPLAGLTAVVGAVVVWASFAASPIAFEPETGTLAAGATTATITGQSGTGTVKFAAGATPTPTPTGGCPVTTPNVPDGPDPWGGCFPGPTTTGPNNVLMPASDKKTLTAYTGPCTITTNNLVIDSKIITCIDGFMIQATGVTIKNSKISEYIVVEADINPNWSLTLQDSEVYGGHYDLATISDGGINLLRVKAHGGHNGFQCDNTSLGCTIKDSYIYGQEIVNTADPHLGGILTDGGPVGMTITHNSVTCDAIDGCTGDINIIPNFATAQYITVANNLLGASNNGAFCTYGGEKPPSAFPHGNHIVYQNNIFQHGTSGVCALYGPVSDFDVTQPGNVWTNNKYTDGEVITCVVRDDCM